MRNILFVLLFIGIPFLGASQQKAAKKSSAATTQAVGNAALQGEPDNSGSICRINGEGLHIALSGKGYDEDGITDKNGSFTFLNVPAGDMVITKTGEEDKESPTCRFAIICGPGGKISKTGTFSQLVKGVTFRMPQTGSVTFGIK